MLNKIESIVKTDSAKQDKLKEFEVRLFCDLLNDEMKKSFSKTVRKFIFFIIFLENLYERKYYSWIFFEIYLL